MHVSDQQLREWSEVVLDQYVSELDLQRRRRLLIVLHEIGEIINPTVRPQLEDPVYI